MEYFCEDRYFSYYFENVSIPGFYFGPSLTPGLLLLMAEVSYFSSYFTQVSSLGSYFGPRLPPGLLLLLEKNNYYSYFFTQVPVPAKAPIPALGCLPAYSYSLRRATNTPATLHRFQCQPGLLLRPLATSCPAPTHGGGQILILLLYTG